MPLTQSRIIIPHVEADYWARKAIDILSCEYNVDDIAFECLGLQTWNPPPWNTDVDDVHRPYFFWVYAWWDRDEELDFPEIPPDKNYFLVGTSPGGGASLIQEEDVEVESWVGYHCDLFDSLHPTQMQELVDSGISHMHILGLGLD